MKRKSRVRRIMVVALLFTLIAGAAVAQNSPLRVRKIQMDARVRTPQYEVRQYNSQSSRKEWFQTLVFYETSPKWIDELEFTFYILVKTRSDSGTREPYILFRDSVTFIDIPEGRHQAAVYLHPHTVERYGDVERVGLEVKYQGRLVARQSEPSANQAWWEQLSPRAGYILNRQQTPFAFVDPDAYEAIKSNSSGR